jgi:uncharacterized protein (TIGR03067 family)
MCRTTLLLAGVLLAIVVIGSDSPKGYDDSVTMDELEGTWQWTEFENALTGKYQPTHYSEMTYRNGTFALTVPDWHGRYHLDPTHKPARIDWTAANYGYQGKTLQYIYQIDGDTLRIGGFPGESTKPRPQGFNIPGLTVWTYKRVKR